MKLSAPKQVTFYIAVIVWIIALIGAWATQLQTAIGPEGLHYWLGLLAGLILVLGCLLDGV